MTIRIIAGIRCEFKKDECNLWHVFIHDPKHPRALAAWPMLTFSQAFREASYEIIRESFSIEKRFELAFPEFMAVFEKFFEPEEYDQVWQLELEDLKREAFPTL